MKTQRFIERSDVIASESSEVRTDSLDGDRSDLFGLRLGVTIQTGARGIEQDLERIDTLHVGGDRNNGDHASPHPLRCGVRSIIAHDDRWSPLVGLRPSDRIEIDEPDLAAAHLAQTVIDRALPEDGIVGISPFGPCVLVRRTEL